MNEIEVDDFDLLERKSVLARRTPEKAGKHLGQWESRRL